MKLYPKCHPYRFGETPELKNVKPPAYGSRGHLLPCSWCDTPDQTEMRERGMLDEELRVSNVDDIKKIIISPQWLKFHRTLIEKPEDAPSCCHRACSEDPNG